MGTVIQMARSGSSEVFREVAKMEGVSPEKLRDRVARGQAVVIRNAERPPKRPVAVGKGLSQR
jgi:hydroxymethylpyrimidine synthase